MARAGPAIRFGGNEARGLIADWARSARSGRYAAEGLAADLEAGLVRTAADIRTVSFADDWLAPRGSLQFLLQKMPLSTAASIELDAATLGAADDHFGWMGSPGAVAAWLGHDPSGAVPTAGRLSIGIARLPAPGIAAHRIHVEPARHPNSVAASVGSA